MRIPRATFTFVAVLNDARVHGVEGTVTIEAVVGEDGLVQSMRVLKGLGFGLDQSALDSVQQWMFSPATQVGTPVSVVAQIDVPFSLANAVFRVGNGVSVPSVQSKVQPEYTDEARLAVVRGTVVLQILVRKDGSVDVLRVVQGLGGGLTENAVEAMKQWKFSPAQAGGEAVNVALNVEVNFNLKDKK